MNKEALDPVSKKKLDEVLIKCRCFQDQGSLNAVFKNSRISKWLGELPDTARNRKERTQRCYEYLFEKKDSKGERVLIHFLEVLRDDHLEEDQLFQELDDLAEDIKSRYGVQNMGPWPSPTDRSSRNSFSIDENGSVRLTNADGVESVGNSSESALLDWLSAWGFERRNPFPDLCWVAEDDNASREVTTQWFYEPPDYSRIRGTVGEPGIKYILAPFGGGKTALLRRISYDLQGLRTLPIEYLFMHGEFMGLYETNQRNFPKASKQEKILLTHSQLIMKGLQQPRNGAEISHLSLERLTPTDVADIFSSWQRLFAYCKQTEREAIAVLVDIERISNEFGINEIFKDYILPLEALSFPRLLLKVFAPIERTVAKNLRLPFDRGGVHILEWDQRGLTSLFCKRIMGNRSRGVSTSRLGQDEQSFNITDMFESSSRPEALQRVREFISSHRTPRALLMLAYHILSLHGNGLASRPDNILPQEPLIALQTVEDAIEISQRHL